MADIDYAMHSRFSDPGRHASLLDDLPTDLVGLSAVARNLIVHYRASGHELPPETQGDVNARWLEDMLALDQERHPADLTAERQITERVQGCCRDHTLFCVGVLRSHGIPARSRVGFAGYFMENFHADHVIVEAWINDRWVRFDSEVEHGSEALPDPLDLGHCEIGSRGFVTAAQAWKGYRDGLIDADLYGIGPDVPVFRGPRFVFDEIIYEVAHRFGDELLLWDGWGRIGEPGQPVSDEDAAWADEVAGLLLAADRGEAGAEAALLERYRSDEGLHPGPVIDQASPFGDPIQRISLDR